MFEDSRGADLPQLPSDEARRPITRSAARINDLAKGLGAQKYLEIGVHRGQTFFGVDIPSKVAVDPNFRFDIESSQQPGVSYFPMTSDEWFLRHSRGQLFDVIFLDGLHTFEQTFRDFCNSLGVAHKKTVWLIDDTGPTDVYSAWPNQGTAIVQRKADFGVESGVWHGDVFKIVFAIHDFFPLLSYRTIAGTGKAQTVVWWQARPDFSPLFNNLETISRLNYFNYLEHQAVRNLNPEAEVLREALAAVLSLDG
jgi:hypothetical protein